MFHFSTFLLLQLTHLRKLLKSNDCHRFVFILCIGCFLHCEKASANSAIHVRDSNWFSIVGEDARSVGFVRDVAAQFENRVDRYFTFPSVRSPILLRLLPKDTDGIEHYRQPQVSVSDLGLVSGALAWDEATTFESVCRLIAWSFLSRLAFYEAGGSGIERLPAWLVVALEHDLLFSLRPAMANVWAQTSLVESGMTMNNLLGADFSLFDQVPNHDAFWFFRAIMERLPERTERRSFFRMVMRDNSRLEDWLPLVDPFVIALNDVKGEALAEMTAEQKLDLWWSWARGYQVSRHRSFYETPFESQQLLQGLLQVEIPSLQLQGRAGLRQLWQRRDESEIQQVVEARITLLASRMERMNPLYFNAAHSLAVLYQILLREPSKTPDFLRSLTDFLSDYEDARVLERDVAEQFR
jgi:hypothetical protein